MAIKKKIPSKKSPAKKKAAKKVAKKTTAKKRKAIPKKKVKDLKAPQVVRTGVSVKKKSASVVFSLDEVGELVALKKTTAEKKARKVVVGKKKRTPVKKTVVQDSPKEKHFLGAASMADILGFNPAERVRHTELGEDEVPKKWKKYYKLLLELRKHFSDEISLHTADTLQNASGGDSGYSNHQADAGTDTFDRDFALGIVSSEQDALNEIEEAIFRIKDGTYGVCEVTGKPIPATRLAAVPFTRFSVAGQTEHEKNHFPQQKQRVELGGIFGDADETPAIPLSDDDDE